MSEYKIILPSMGEDVKEATIIKWLKNEGDFIKKEDVIVEISTDKINSEIISPINGILKKKLFINDDLVKVGESIAILEIKNNINKLKKENIKKKCRFYSPLIKNIARKEGINFYELEMVEGSGKNNRITKKDLIEYIKIKNKKKNFSKFFSSKQNFINQEKNEEILNMSRARMIIAKNMIKSKKDSAHVTSFVEADVTNIMKWRKKIKDKFQKNTGERLTLMSIFVECVVKAIKDFPMINISVNGKSIIRKKNINIGLATALPNGDLIVPVIKHADSYNLRELIKIINDLVERARNNKLKVEETRDGTYTISNIGSFGNLFGTPIIYQPQVAIMAIGLIHKKLSIIETESKEDLIGIRYKMYLSHSYDHRVIDGVLGGNFAKKVALYLEKFDCYKNI